MDRYVKVASPDTGKVLAVWVVDDAILQQACAYLADKAPWLEVRPLPPCFKPKAGSTVQWFDPMIIGG